MLRGTGTGDAEKAQPWELPRGVLIEASAWSEEDGTMTGTQKLRRAALEARYKGALVAMYEDLHGAPVRHPAHANISTAAHNHLF